MAICLRKSGENLGFGFSIWVRVRVRLRLRVRSELGLVVPISRKGLSATIGRLPIVANRPMH